MRVKTLKYGVTITGMKSGDTDVIFGHAIHTGPQTKEETEESKKKTHTLRGEHDLFLAGEVRNTQRNV